MRENLLHLFCLFKQISNLRASENAMGALFQAKTTDHELMSIWKSPLLGCCKRIEIFSLIPVFIWLQTTLFG